MYKTDANLFTFAAFIVSFYANVAVANSML